MILKNIKTLQDLKNLSPKQLPELTKELRQRIIDVVGKNGGHLASNLGVVELTVALHRTFESPEDAIIWDVGHQCYAHKILTGRNGDFEGLRKKDGISGFTRKNESPHDYFDAGHASSSISSALGLLTAWKAQGRNSKVVAVIGDGALTGGMAYEALNHAGQLASNLIVVLNDNQMSISRNTGSISRYLSKLTMSRPYQSIRRGFDKLVERIPAKRSNVFGKFLYRFKRSLKSLLLTTNFFSDLGFEYFGPLNGHDIRQLEACFSKVKKINRPVVVHVMTKKGKGYYPAENDPSSFHGVGPFNTIDGVVEKFDRESFTEVFSHQITELGKENSRICAITAAMAKGTGLSGFARHFPDRFFDVGIAEEHAVTFAGGLAAGGMVPVVAIYSTFIQRSVDQIIEDLALSHRHAVLVLDRSGAVPGDGETHQGIFDIALLKPIPGVSILSPAGTEDLEKCLRWSVGKNDGTAVIRIPKATCPTSVPAFSCEIREGRGLLITGDDFAPSVYARYQGDVEKGLSKGERSVLYVCTGSMYHEAVQAARTLLLSGIRADIYTLRFIKPFDFEYFLDIAGRYARVVFVEDGIISGSISADIERRMRLSAECKDVETCIRAFREDWIPSSTRMQILEDQGLDSESLAQAGFGE